jgi:peptidoglycan hydrolase CwlO-like protein
MQQLEQRLEQRDLAVRQSGAEVQAATEELRKTVTHVETWRKEADELRTQMHNRDKEEIDMLKKQIQLVERLLAEESPASSSSPIDNDQAPQR